MKKSQIPHWWKVFIAEYLKNGQNAKRAYMKARPKVKESTAEANSTVLLGNTKFLALLKETQEKLEDKIELSLEEWVQLVADICRFDLRKYITREEGSGDIQLIPEWKDYRDGHAFEGISFATTTQENGQVVQRVQIKAHPKMKALEVLGKALGYLTEKVEHTGSVEVVNPYAQPEKD